MVQRRRSSALVRIRWYEALAELPRIRWYTHACTSMGSLVEVHQESDWTSCRDYRCSICWCIHSHIEAWTNTGEHRSVCWGSSWSLTDGTHCCAYIYIFILYKVNFKHLSLSIYLVQPYMSRYITWCYIWYYTYYYIISKYGRQHDEQHDECDTWWTYKDDIW